MAVTRLAARNGIDDELVTAVGVQETKHPYLGQPVRCGGLTQAGPAGSRGPQDRECRDAEGMDPLSVLVDQREFDLTVDDDTAGQRDDLLVPAAPVLLQRAVIVRDIVQGQREAGAGRAHLGGQPGQCFNGLPHRVAEYPVR